MRQRGAAWARFALALVALPACRAAEPISVEQRWLKAPDDENTPPGEWLFLAGSEAWLEQWSLLAPWEPESELHVLSRERDPATRTWVESWLDVDVGRKVVDWSAAAPNELFVVSDTGTGVSVIDRFRVTPPAGGYRAVRPRGGPTRYELIGDRFIPPLERDKATIERFEIARIEGPVVAIAAEPNARNLLAFVRRDHGPSQALQIDTTTGATTVLADSAQFPQLSEVRSLGTFSHARHGFVVEALLNTADHELVFADRDRDGDFDDVRLLTRDEFEAAGYNDSAQLLDH